MRLAISLLCENPERPAGVSSMFRSMLQCSSRLFPDVTWIVFVAADHEIISSVPGVEWHTNYPGNNRVGPRLVADHFLVAARAKSLGARALLTNGFVPVRCPLPCIMHLLSLHHLDPENQMSRLNNVYRRLVVATGVRRAELVITNSQFSAKQIMGSSGMDPAKLMISNEGIDHSIFHPNPSEGEVEGMKSTFGLRPGYVLCLSNLYPYKQSRLVLEAFARLPARLRSQHPLVYVGGDWSGQREELAAAARTRGIVDDVRFLGWVESGWIPALYRQAWAHALASREETWGRTVTEAMACGCPCIVNDIPVMDEVAIGHALIVDFSDTEAATRGLERILIDGSLRSRLRSGGIERAAQLSFDRLTRERMSRIRRFLS